MNLTHPIEVWFGGELVLRNPTPLPIERRVQGRFVNTFRGPVNRSTQRGHLAASCPRPPAEAGYFVDLWHAFFE
jgi:hypothetical protein